MNMHLSTIDMTVLADIAQGEVERLFERAAQSVARNVRHPEPFAKRKEGEKRRTARRQAIARKRAYLD